jgi:hypothetical protein
MATPMYVVAAPRPGAPATPIYITSRREAQEVTLVGASTKGATAAFIVTGPTTPGAVEVRLTGSR